MNILGQLTELVEKAAITPNPIIAAFWFLVEHQNGNSTGYMVIDIEEGDGPNNYIEAMVAVLLGFSDCPEFDEKGDEKGDEAGR
jgi:hypothetical protein